jgi:hypothetical protein
MITRPEESYRVSVCVIKKPWKGRLRLNQGGREARGGGGESLHKLVVHNVFVDIFKDIDYLGNTAVKGHAYVF